MIGDYNVNDTDYSGDNYRKGAMILHMLRQIVNDDEKWRQLLRGLNQEFYHQTVTTKQVEDYIAEQSGLNLDSFWDQYLRTTQIPVFEYYFVSNQLSYRWTNCIGEFEMPLKIMLNEKEKWIYPKTDWQVESIEMKKVEIVVNRNFYVPVLYSNLK
jgi:aminopeptidase N